MRINKQIMSKILPKAAIWFMCCGLISDVFLSPPWQLSAAFAIAGYFYVYRPLAKMSKKVSAETPNQAGQKEAPVSSTPPAPTPSKEEEPEPTLQVPAQKKAEWTQAVQNIMVSAAGGTFGWQWASRHDCREIYVFPDGDYNHAQIGEVLYSTDWDVMAVKLPGRVLTNQAWKDKKLAEDVIAYDVVSEFFQIRSDGDKYSFSCDIIDTKNMVLSGKISANSKKLKVENAPCIAYLEQAETGLRISSMKVTTPSGAVKTLKRGKGAANASCEEKSSQDATPAPVTKDSSVKDTNWDKDPGLTDEQIYANCEIIANEFEFQLSNMATSELDKIPDSPTAQVKFLCPEGLLSEKEARMFAEFLCNKSPCYSNPVLVSEEKNGVVEHLIILTVTRVNDEDLLDEETTEQAEPSVSACSEIELDNAVEELKEKVASLLASGFDGEDGGDVSIPIPDGVCAESFAQAIHERVRDLVDGYEVRESTNEVVFYIDAIA